MKAIEIARTANESISNNTKLLADLNDTTNQSSVILDGAIRQQQLMDELLAEVNNAKTVADAAVAAAEHTLGEADSTLATLKGMLPVVGTYLTSASNRCSRPRPFDL